MEKVYLIIGASSDLGCALIREIIRVEDSKNIAILAHYHSSCAALDKIAEEYPLLNLMMLQADLSNLKDTQRFISVMYGRNLFPTHIVNLSANTFHHTRLSEWDSELVNRDMAIQVYSFAEILKAFIPYMVKNHYGKIVVMLTAYTIGVPPKNMSGYVTVKYALLGLMKSVASDFGDQGININGVSPGMINTKFINNIGRKIKEFAAQSNPKHRNLETADVIPTICLLLSNEAEFISGSNVNLSGSSE